MGSVRFEAGGLRWLATDAAVCELAPDLERTGAANQAVGNPALQDRVIVGKRPGGQVERVAIRHAIADFPSTSRCQAWPPQTLPPSTCPYQKPRAD